MNRTLTGSTASGLSGPGSNDNEGVYHAPQSYRNGSLSPDVVQCHTQDTIFAGVGLASLQGYIQHICSAVKG